MLLAGPGAIDGLKQGKQHHRRLRNQRETDRPDKLRQGAAGAG